MAQARTLTGIPLGIVPPSRVQETSSVDLLADLDRQVCGMLCEVGNIHAFSRLMDEHGDDALQGVAEQIALYMRHFDTRLHEMESILTVLRGRG